jgi:hypothetical protein
MDNTSKTVIWRDSEGGTDYMVRIKKFFLDEVIDGASHVPHPAFVVGGKEVDEICISKYANAVRGIKPYSLPYRQGPTILLCFNKAIGLCERKGKGWHLMTNAEWAAIELWCLKAGTLPSLKNRMP